MQKSGILQKNGLMQKCGILQTEQWSSVEKWYNVEKWYIVEKWSNVEKWYDVEKWSTVVQKSGLVQKSDLMQNVGGQLDDSLCPPPPPPPPVETLQGGMENTKSIQKGNCVPGSYFVGGKTEASPALRISFSSFHFSESSANLFPRLPLTFPLVSLAAACSWSFHS